MIDGLRPNGRWLLQRSALYLIKLELMTDELLLQHMVFNGFDLLSTRLSRYVVDQERGLRSLDVCVGASLSLSVEPEHLPSAL